MGEGNHGLTIVEHIIATNLIGAVSQTMGMLVIGRHQ